MWSLWRASTRVEARQCVSRRHATLRVRWERGLKVKSLNHFWSHDLRSYRYYNSFPPSTYVFNFDGLSKSHALEQLTADLISYDVAVAVISETHFKSKHSP